MDPTSPIRRISRFKLSDSITVEIEGLIRDGTYAPGDKLPSERVLADQFGVGRSSMREALRALEERGFVNIVHGLGVYIAEGPSKRNALADFLVLDDCTIPELFDVRRAIECLAAGLAAKRITATDAAELEAQLASLGDEQITDAEYVHRDATLHRLIVEATRNNLLIRIYESTRHLFIEYSGRVIQLPGRRPNAQEGHAQIVAAIVSKQPKAAQKAMEAHLQAVEHDIVAYLDAAALEQEEAGFTHDGGGAVPPAQEQPETT